MNSRQTTIPGLTASAAAEESFERLSSSPTQLDVRLIELERTGDAQGAARLLQGLVMSTRETAELAWMLYLNSAFQSAKLLLENLGRGRFSPPLEFALAHIRLAEGDAALAKNFSQTCRHWKDVHLHVPAFRAALEHAFSDSFHRFMECRDDEKIEHLEALYRSLKPWLEREEDGSIVRLSETLLAIPLDQETRLFVATDKNAATECLAILNDAAYGLKNLEGFLSVDRKTVLDVGANAGAFTFLAARLWPESRVLAFEPGKSAFDCLHHNTRRLDGVEVFHTGLGDKDHKPVLHSSIVGTLGGTIANSAISTDGKEIVDIRDAGAIMAECGVTEIDILKLDTEGCECAILSRLGELACRARVIFLEYHSEEDRRKLDAMLSATHHAFSGRILHPHRGELCFLRRDLAEPWDVFRISPSNVPGQPLK